MHGRPLTAAHSAFTRFPHKIINKTTAMPSTHTPKQLMRSNNNQSNNRMEALRNRRSGSMLQMIQTLEICSTAIKKFIMPDDIAFHNATDGSDCCNDDGDSFTSAMSGSNDSTFTLSDNDSTALIDLPFEIDTATPTSPTAFDNLPKITSTRRQRRKQDKSSANYSDFCDNDLSRQIEAMALEVETAFESRHLSVKKSRQSAAELLLNDYPVAEELEVQVAEEVESSSSACEPIKDEPFTQSSTRVPVLQRMTNKKIYFNNGVPAMVASDSLASFASDYSFDTRSPFDFASMASFKKSQKIYSSQSNAEWAIIE